MNPIFENLLTEDNFIKLGCGLVIFKLMFEYNHGKPGRYSTNDAGKKYFNNLFLATLCMYSHTHTQI